MEQDSKIRQYVQKKQQQKERANFLRQQRRNQQGGGGSTNDQQRSNNYGGGSRNSFASNSRKIADPFASVNNENDSGNVNASNPPPWNNDTSSNPPYDNQYDDGNKFQGNNRGSYRGGSGGGGFNQQNSVGGGGGAFDQNNDPEYNDYDHNGGAGVGVGGNDNGNWNNHTTPMPKPNRRGNGGQFTNQQNNRNGRGYRNGGGGGGGGNNMGRTNSRNPSVAARQTRSSVVPPNKRFNSKPSWNSNTNANADQFDGASEPMDNRLSRSQSTDNDVPFATADDVKKVLAMVEQLRGQMHALQFQLDNVKMENRKLQQSVGDMAKQQQETQQQLQQQHLQPRSMPPPSNMGNQSQNNLAPPTSNRFQDRVQDNGHPQQQRMNRRNRPRDASMDIDNDMPRHGAGNGNGNVGGNGPMRMSQSLRQLKVKKQQMSPGGNGGDRSDRSSFAGNGGFGGNGGFDGNNGSNNMQRGGNQQEERQQRFGGHQRGKNGRDNGNGGGGGGMSGGGMSGGGMSNDFGNGNNNGFGGGNSNGFGGDNNNHKTNGFGMANKREMPGHRGGSMQNRGRPQMDDMNGGDEDEDEVAAPPPSTAQDLLAKLDEQAAQFGGLEQNVERVQCHQCGRKFSQSALQRHMKICKKVFGQKRKAFNMKKQRGDDEAIKAARNKNPEVEAELKRKKEAAKKKWKAQSAMLRNAVRSSKQIDQAMKDGVPLSDLPQMQSIPVEDTRTPCPHCGRKFAEETAKRHIPKCQNIKSRPKALRRKR